MTGNDRVPTNLGDALEEIERLQKANVKLVSKVRNLERKVVWFKTSLEYEQRHNESTVAWARNAFDQERYLQRRCEYLYALATAKGATREELSRCTTCLHERFPEHETGFWSGFCECECHPLAKTDSGRSHEGV